jgi:hypothetical protein
MVGMWRKDKSEDSRLKMQKKNNVTKWRQQKSADFSTSLRKVQQVSRWWLLWWTIHFFNYQIALELFRQGDDDEDGIARNHMFPRTKCLSQRQCEEPGLCDGCGFYFVWRSCGSHCQHCAGLISKTKFPTSSPRRAWCGIKKVLRDSILTRVTYMKRHLYEASQQPFQCKLQAWFFRRFVQVTLPRMESQETLRFFLLLGV